MKAVLAVVLSLVATAAMAAPVSNSKDAIKVGCAAIRNRLAGDTGDCSDFAAVLRGDVWTVSQKKLPDNLIGGGAPVVEISQETGEILNFYLTD